MCIRVVTNHIPRETIWWDQLSPKEQKEFSYLDTEEKQQNAEFVRYRGWVYDIHEFLYTGPSSQLSKWDGYSSDSFFSGVVIKWAGEDRGGVILGTYLS